MSMNDVIILFEPTGSATNYDSITLQTQDAIRCPAFTLLGQLAKPGITAKDKHKLKETHKRVQKNGGTLIDINKPAAATKIQAVVRGRQTRNRIPRSSTTASTKPGT